MAEAALPSEEQILNALRVVNDPELGLNVVDLGLVYGVEVDDQGNVKIRMTLTFPGCPLGAEVTQDVRAALSIVPGVRDVDVEIVWQPPWTPEMMSEDAKRALGWAF
ncbi:MAG: metal-sulfur cluster assembly factor [Clostridia bacterium]|jgi:metal-sulfur cluster biosynthetic enzyme|nr:metal-sulfur cluster assembly factor [Clostridia bacterium]MCL6522471.1 metal-sulfur cluster assembly factor [Bacillota bacterium]